MDKRNGDEAKVAVGSFYIPIENKHFNLKVPFSLSSQIIIFKLFKEKCRKEKVRVTEKCFEFLLAEMRLTKTKFYDEVNAICIKSFSTAKGNKLIADQLVIEETKELVRILINEKQQASLSQKLAIRIKKYVEKE